VIVTNFTLGLGNQLFQYATGYALARQKKTEHTIDIASGLSATRSQNHIYLFSPESREVRVSELKELSWIFDFPYRALSEIRYDEHILKSLDPSLWIESKFGYSAEFRANPQDTGYLLGYWQAYPYFEDFIHDLRRQLSVSAPLSERTRRIADAIRNSNSIFLHIRRGDYLKPAHARFHGNLDIRYYANGLERILKQSSNAALYVFSDDMEWSKQNIRSSLPTTFVDHTSAATAHEDFHLMTLCRHSIVANSSFSWWAAWLSEQTGIRIAPKKWFAIEKLNRQTHTLIPPSWVRI